ncbi:MAG TPA: T9SS type A sorting domain-containing protein [Flavisolibacter sp.]|nr:T9SS type A sorting domain-containing protein [Flavisolibacter sp.]
MRKLLFLNTFLCVVFLGKAQKEPRSTEVVSDPASNSNDYIGLYTTKVQAPLSVKLASFTVKRNKEKVYFAWQTAMEVNNSGFDIQRKTDDNEWKTIAFMFSKATAENSNTVLTYEYTDVSPTKDVSYYRLRQVDIDTRYVLSEVVTVGSEERANPLRIYPNPSTEDKVNVVFDEYNGNRHIVVSDITGRIIQQYQNVTDNSMLINNLETGMYTIQITNINTGKRTIEKVIIKKR